MAIGFVGAACALTAASTGTTLAVTLPSAFSASNLLLVGIGTRNAGTPSITGPAGWTQIAASIISSGNNLRSAMFYRVSDGSETSSCTFTLSSQNSIVGVSGAFSGVDTANPIYSSGSMDSPATSSASFLVLAPAIINTELVYFNATANALTSTPDANITERIDAQSSGATNLVSGTLNTEYWTSSGASSVRVNTLSGAAVNNIGWSVALTPAGALTAGGALPLVDVQMQFSGSAVGWTNVGSDVLVEPGVSVSYGIMGNGPEDRVAATGTMNFALDNSAHNSGGKLGYYSPGNSNARAGFELGIGTRLALTYSGSTFYKFTGRLDEIDPQPGQFLGRQTLCTAVDWIDEAARHPLNRIATQFSVTADQIIATTIGNMSRTPAACSLAVAQQKYPYALDTGFDESTTALTELQRVAQSDRGFVVIRGDQTQGGTLTYFDRRQRMNGISSGIQPLSASTILQTNMIQMHTPRPRGQVYNRIYTTAHPRIVDGALTTVLYVLTSQPTIANGETAIFEGGYTDPALRSQRVAAASMLTPVAGVDFTAGTSTCDFSMNDVVVIAGSYGSNTLRLAVTNNSAHLKLVLNRLQVRGAGIYDYSPVTNQAQDAISIANYGQARLSVDMPYESSVTVASAIGDYDLAQWKNPRYAPDSVTFVGTGNACLMDAGLRREPGDVIGITENVVGLSASEFFVQSVHLTISGRSRAVFSWGLQDRSDFTDYWVLNVDKLAETSADSGSQWSVLGL